MRRVLFLHQNAVLGGAELELLEVARMFRESSMVVLFSDGPFRAKLEGCGVKVRILASAWSQEGVRGGVPRPNARGVAAVLRLAVRIAWLARRYEVIYANSPKAMTIAWLAGRVAHRPVLWAFQDLLETSHFSPAAIRQMVMVANRGADRVIACSQAGADSVAHQGGPAGRTHVVHHGIDPAPFADDGASGAVLRHELGLGEAPLAAVFGRITEWKGQHVAVDLLAEVPELHLLLVGNPSEDPPYAERLRSRAGQLGVAGRLHLLGHRDDIPRLMRMVDIILHTSTSPEPFGRVVVEGMLSGRPVIATAAGGVPEIIEDGVSGLLVPPGDVAALAASVTRLLRDPELARTLALAGSARAREHFTLDVMLTALRTHIEEVAKR